MIYAINSLKLENSKTKLDFLFHLYLLQGFIGEKSYMMTKLGNNNFESEQIDIDLTLKLSPCGQVAEEEKNYEEEKAESSVLCVQDENKCLVRFGDLQTMRRMRTSKRLLLEKQRRAAESSKLNTLPNPSPSPSPSSHHTQGEGEASSNINKIPVRPPSSNDTMVDESPAKKLNKGDAMDILRKMPSVTTTGDGPKGKRIEGLLYKYKGGQVSILCLCHGTFLSPAEFVMHAGGNQVADPMKHITLS